MSLLVNPVQQSRLFPPSRPVETAGSMAFNAPSETAGSVASAPSSCGESFNAIA